MAAISTAGIVVIVRLLFFDQWGVVHTIGVVRGADLEFSVESIPSDGANAGRG